MNKLSAKPARMMLFVCGGLSGASLVISSLVWADDTAGSIRLVIGDRNTQRHSGDVVVTESGNAFGEEAFPAISADGGEVAILYGSHEYVTGLGVDIIDIVEQASVKQFNINWPVEAKTPELRVERIRERLESVNAYLENHGFTTLSKLYDFNYIFSSDYRNRYAGMELPEYWQEESGQWRIAYWNKDETLEIFEEDSDEAVLILRPPLLIYGIGPGFLCSTRSMPVKGWYDEKTDVLVLRLLFAPGAHHACDRPDRWFVTRLRDS